jgi:hypothetical protein
VTTNATKRHKDRHRRNGYTGKTLFAFRLGEKTKDEGVKCTRKLLIGAREEANSCSILCSSLHRLAVSSLKDKFTTKQTPTSRTAHKNGSTKLNFWDIPCHKVIELTVKKTHRTTPGAFQITLSGLSNSSNVGGLMARHTNTANTATPPIRQILAANDADPSSN